MYSWTGGKRDIVRRAQQQQRLGQVAVPSVPGAMHGSNFHRNIRKSAISSLAAHPDRSLGRPSSSYVGEARELHDPPNTGHFSHPAKRSLDISQHDTIPTSAAKRARTSALLHGHSVTTQRTSTPQHPQSSRPVATIARFHPHQSKPPRPHLAPSHSTFPRIPQASAGPQHGGGRCDGLEIDFPRTQVVPPSDAIDIIMRRFFCPPLPPLDAYGY